ncbi:sulfurtransferase-like selenium metabolism protein YedF [uncultured Clostridium sp.]|jgi:selenium metabolism protein YedF|uniref:sulfurtransferase-like selenium metabolism protein YedF n=1 Tax=uncultured Clostridium sp. TaxID=59620 RepID=UPI00262CEED0|nr:sulfurtransferase-like selenium metabolism protein YedF [uncultured Clostridium sp.]
MENIDCRGLICPMPVINTKKYFDSISVGMAKIIVDNEISQKNLEKFALANGFACSIENGDDEFILTMEKLKESSKEEINKDEFSILIGSNKLGNGDDALGETLMKGYIYALSESDKLPRKIMFLNAGVKLVASTSSVLESLESLKAKGVEILSCGVCLDFYGLKEIVSIGEVTNMYAIVEEMNSVTKLITL